MKFSTLRILILLVLIVGIWQSVTIAAAAGITRSVSLSLSDATPSEASMRLAARRLDTALSFEPDYIPALYLLERTTHDLEERVRIVQHITSIQPNEVKAWGLLFRLSLEYAPAYHLADVSLESIEENGAWDPVTNWLVIEAGTRHWLSLSHGQREQVLLASTRAATSTAGWVKGESMSLIEQRGFARMVCSAIENREQVPMCRRV